MTEDRGKEGCLSDVFYGLFVREGLVQDDVKITDGRGGGFCGAVDIEGEVMGGFGECFWSNDNYF